jgi:hypothetical protein
MSHLCYSLICDLLLLFLHRSFQFLFFYLLKYSPIFCSFSLFLFLTIFVIQVSGSLPLPAPFSKFWFSHLWVCDFFPPSLLHMRHIACSIFSVHPSAFKHPFSAILYIHYPPGCVLLCIVSFLIYSSIHWKIPDVNVNTIQALNTVKPLELVAVPRWFMWSIYVPWCSDEKLQNAAVFSTYSWAAVGWSRQLFCL